MSHKAIVIWTAALALAGCQQPANTYLVKHIANASIQIDGRLTEAAWQKARLLTDFRDPWAGGGEPTGFRAFVDGENLYFAFVCAEATPRISNEWKGKKTLDSEDRVEIYFALDDKLEKYYCIEIDPEGRVHDFAGAIPRKWDDSWSMPGLKTAGTTRKVLTYKTVADEYIVEGSIPLAALEALGLPPLKSGQAWRVGLFRADLGLAGPKSDRWITWIVPSSAKPNFHTPSAFGSFRIDRGWGL